MLHISHLLLLILPEELLASSVSSFAHGMPGGTQLLEDWQDKAHPQEKQIVFSRMFETICHLLCEIRSHLKCCWTLIHFSIQGEAAPKKGRI